MANTMKWTESSQAVDKNVQSNFHTFAIVSKVAVRIKVSNLSKSAHSVNETILNHTVSTFTNI